MGFNSAFKGLRPFVSRHVLPWELTDWIGLANCVEVSHQMIWSEFNFGSCLPTLTASLREIQTGLQQIPERKNRFFYGLLTVHLGMILQITNLTHSFSCMFVSILYMFRAATCPSSGELLCQFDTWLVSHCADDSLICRLIFISEGHLHRVT